MGEDSTQWIYVYNIDHLCLILWKMDCSQWNMWSQSTVEVLLLSDARKQLAHALTGSEHSSSLNLHLLYTWVPSFSREFCITMSASGRAAKWMLFSWMEITWHNPSFLVMGWLLLWDLMSIPLFCQVLLPTCYPVSLRESLPCIEQ